MSRGNLMLHTGGWEATRQEIDAVPLPPATQTYTPVPHGHFIDLFKERIPSIGMKVGRERYGLARSGNQLFGVIDCQNGVNADDYTLALGLRHSYDKSFAAAGVAGSRVFVCDNLAMSGEVHMNRKHTAYIMRDLPFLVDEMLHRLKPMAERVKQEIESMKEIDVDDRTAHDIMIRAMRLDITPTSRLAAVEKEWREPTHEEFLPRTAWSLFNAFTSVERNKGTVFRRTIALTSLFRNNELAQVVANN